MLGSWTTSAHFIFNGLRFRVSIPISHMTLPYVQTVKYNPETQCIDIEGYMKEQQKNTPKQSIHEMEHTQPKNM